MARLRLLPGGSGSGQFPKNGRAALTVKSPRIARSRPKHRRAPAQSRRLSPTFSPDPCRRQTGKRCPRAARVVGNNTVPTRSYSARPPCPQLMINAPTTTVPTNETYSRSAAECTSCRATDYCVFSQGDGLAAAISAHCQTEKLPLLVEGSVSWSAALPIIARRAPVDPAHLAIVDDAVHHQ
jgi:hypothetical protein